MTDGALGLQVGLVAFADASTGVLRPTDDRDAVRAALARLSAEGGTATGDALATALDALPDRDGDDPPPAAVVLLSDGATSTGEDHVEIAADARAAGVPVYTVALGTEDGVIEQGGQTIRVASDPEALAEVARASGGRSFAAEDSRALDEVYERLGSQIGTREEQREVTAGFAAAGLLLLGAGVATSRSDAP